MLYLLLALLSSTGVSLSLRLSKKYSQSNYGLLCMNYSMCIFLATQGSIDHILIHTDFLITMGLSIISGILFMISFVALQSNIQSNGLVYSSLFAKLGIIVPLVTSILFFHEHPSVYAIIGLGLAILGIIYLNHADSSIVSITSLLFLLLIGGLTDVQSKIFAEIGNIANNDAYLFFTFFFALLTSIIFLVMKKQRIGKYEILFGFLVGIPNYFSARFLLHSLNTLPGILVYPIYSVGTILLISLCGILFFHEKLSKRAILAYLMMLVSIILLNL